MEKTLIVDDTTFTGWTNLKTMELWGLEPKMTTHSFLIANTGMLDEKNCVFGAVKNLEACGSRVIFGHELSTPGDDGWHLKDLHQHQNLSEAFDMGLSLLELMEIEGPDSESFKLALQKESTLSTIFPNRFSPSQIKTMINEGRFISSGKVNLDQNDLVHTKNPLLWASRYFKEHIDLYNVIDHRDEIKDILFELKTLTNDPEARSEGANELKNITQRHTMVEGNCRNSAER